ncbi:MAG: hypothetical protein ACI8ZB_000541 [Desulforhopalus sp.]|jgi:hypothetical protein
MKTRNKKDTLTGLVALSADKAPLKRECFSAEEFAVLIEGKISPEQRQELMEHLGHCEICYNQWLAIKSETQSTAASKIFPILPKKLYKYVGSSLAIAASVVVFLNVYTPPVKEVSPVSQDSILLKESSTSYLDTATEPTDEKKRVDEEQEEAKKTASPVPSKNMQKSYSRGKAERIMQKREAASPARESEVSGSLAPVMKSSARGKMVEHVGSSTKDEFYSLVTEGCGKSEFDQKYWLELEARGMELVHTQSFTTRAEKEKFVRLTALLGTMQRQTWRNQCDAISRLVAEDIKSR